MNEQQMETIVTNLRRAKYLRLISVSNIPVRESMELRMKFEDPQWIALQRITALAKEYF